MQLVFLRRNGVRPHALAAALAASLWTGPAFGQEFLPPPRAAEPSPTAEAVATPDAAIPVGEMVAEVRIVGNDTTSTVQVSSNLKTRAGRPFDASVVQNDVA